MIKLHPVSPGIFGLVHGRVGPLYQVGLTGFVVVRARLRLMVKRILRKYKYPPDMQDAAVELVLQQAQVMGESWA